MQCQKVLRLTLQTSNFKSSCRKILNVLASRYCSECVYLSTHCYPILGLGFSGSIGRGRIPVPSKRNAPADDGIIMYFTYSNIDTASNHHETELMEKSSHERVLMPSITHSSCPPRSRGNQSTPMDPPSPACHQHLNILSPKASLRRDQAQADGMDIVDDEVQPRALLHQSAESWTRRHRAEIR